MTKIFETKNREESHRALEYALGQREVNGPDPDWPGTEKMAGYFGLAECREDSADGIYSVWLTE